MCFQGLAKKFSEKFSEKVLPNNKKTKVKKIQAKVERATLYVFETPADFRRHPKSGIMELLQYETDVLKVRKQYRVD